MEDHPTFVLGDSEYIRTGNVTGWDHDKQGYAAVQITFTDGLLVSVPGRWLRRMCMTVELDRLEEEMKHER